MKRIVVVAVLVVATACSGQPIHVVPDEDLPRALYPQGQRGGDQSRTVQVIVHLIEGNRLVAVSRTGQSQLAPPELVMRALLAGPTQRELGRSFRSDIPEAVELVSISVSNDVADVDLTSQSDSDRFADNVDRDEYILRLAQVVYSLTELEQIDAVRLLDEGQPVTVLDQNGEVVDGPVARGRYSRFAPVSSVGDPASEGELVLDVPGPEEAADPRSVEAGPSS